MAFRKKIIVGNHFSFIRGGTEEGEDTFDKDTAPTAAATSWLTFSSASTATTELNQELATINAPVENGGAYQLAASIPKSTELALIIGLTDVSPIMFEMGFAAGGEISLEGGTAGEYIPGGGNGALEGWWHVEQYDHTNTKINDLIFWGTATVSQAPAFGEEIVAWEIRLVIVANALNKGKITSFTA